MFFGQMSIVRITNGFHSHVGASLLLTGTLEKGEIESGDFLVLDKDTKIPIIDVECDKETFPGTTHVRLMVSPDHDVIWHKLYRREFEIENTRYKSCRHM